MSIEDFKEKIKGFSQIRKFVPKIIPDDVFLGLIIILTAFGSFGLGRFSKIATTKVPIRVENAPKITADTFSTKTTESQTTPTFETSSGQLVASKSGKKYYYQWCTGVQKIKEENRIYFASKAEAEIRGYEPSSTCKGL